MGPRSTARRRAVILRDHAPRRPAASACSSHGSETRADRAFRGSNSISAWEGFRPWRHRRRESVATRRRGRPSRRAFVRNSVSRRAVELAAERRQGIAFFKPAVSRSHRPQLAKSASAHPRSHRPRRRRGEIAATGWPPVELGRVVLAGPLAVLEAALNSRIEGGRSSSPDARSGSGARWRPQRAEQRRQPRSKSARTRIKQSRCSEARQI